MSTRVSPSVQLEARRGRGSGSPSVGLLCGRGSSSARGRARTRPPRRRASPAASPRRRSVRTRAQRARRRRPRRPPCATCASWASPNQPPSSSASLRTRCRLGAAWVTTSWACVEASGLGQARDGGVDLLGGVGALGHARGIIGSMAVRLTSLSHGAGCGCKLPPATLHAHRRARCRAPDGPRRARRRRRRPTTPASSSVRRRPRARADRRLLHADRRRPLRLRAHRRDQRAERRLRDGRRAASAR